MTPKETILEVIKEAKITITFSTPLPGVDGDWPYIAYTVVVNGTPQSYKLGVGHAKIPKGEPLVRGLDEDERSALYQLQSRPFTKFKDPMLHARLATKLAISQKVVPDIADSIAALVRDGEALYQTFEEWAAEYGYDEDSRKAEKTYQACSEIGRHVRKWFTDDQRNRIAQAASEL